MGVRYRRDIDALMVWILNNYPLCTWRGLNPRWIDVRVIDRCIRQSIYQLVLPLVHKRKRRIDNRQI